MKVEAPQSLTDTAPFLKVAVAGFADCCVGAACVRASMAVKTVAMCTCILGGLQEDMRAFACGGGWLLSLNLRCV